MRVTMLIAGIALILGAMFAHSETALQDPTGKLSSGSAEPDAQTLKGNLGPQTEVTITYSARSSPATVHIGQKKFVGYRNQSVIYFSEFIKDKTDVGYELELSPDFDPEGDDFVYRIPGTVVSVACGSPDSLILTIFRNGRREGATCIE